MDRLAGVKAKVKRAKKHVLDLQTEIKAFIDTQPYVVATNRNPDTRQVMYYLASVREVPREVALIAGDILQNLRSALDHLAYQLVVVGEGHDGPFTHVYFPIFESADKYEAGKLGQIKGMRDAAIEAIDAVKPYKGGNDTFWQIHRLNIVDKHRLLFTVGSAFNAVDIGAVMNREMKKSLPDWMTDLPDLSIFIRPADRQFPLKAGDELFGDGPDSEPNENIKFAFDVAINEPGVIEDEPLIETLHQMVDLVDNLIPQLRVLLL